MTPSARQVYEFGPFRLDAAKGVLWRGEQAVSLTPRLIEMLLALVENRERVIEKDELMSRLWPDTIVEEANLTVNVSALRKALGQRGNENRYIVTVPDSVKGDAVLVGHAVLVAPNQALWVLAPAMGACDDAVVDGRATPFLCYWRVPTTFPIAPSTVGLTPSVVAYHRPARGYLGFLLVPLLATVVGGARAAHGRLSRRERLVLGAASGLVFASLTTVAFALARIDASASGGFLGRSSFRLGFGPEVLRGGVLALAWGVAGGALGAVLGSGRARQPAPGIGATNE